MDMNNLSADERMIAEQAVLAFQASLAAARGAEHGHGMEVTEKAVLEKGYEVMRKMLELSVSEQAEAQKKGSPANRAGATGR